MIKFLLWALIVILLTIVVSSGMYFYLGETAWQALRKTEGFRSWTFVSCLFGWWTSDLYKGAVEK